MTAAVTAVGTRAILGMVQEGSSAPRAAALSQTSGVQVESFPPARPALYFSRERAVGGKEQDDVTQGFVEIKC